MLDENCWHTIPNEANQACLAVGGVDRASSPDAQDYMFKPSSIYLHLLQCDRVTRSNVRRNFDFLDVFEDRAWDSRKNMYHSNRTLF